MFHRKGIFPVGEASGKAFGAMGVYQPLTDLVETVQIVQSNGKIAS